MTSTEVLQAAYKRIENPENWIQDDFEVVVYDPASPNKERTCYCLMGAVLPGGDDCRTDAQRDALAFLRTAINELFPVPIYASGIISFNDRPGRKHPEVLAALSRAIDLSQPNRSTP